MDASGSGVGVGLAACGIASLFFGTMFVPIKPYNTGDGLFVQWVISVAILVVGFIVNAIVGFPPFYPLAMLGGVSWAIGNITAVPIINAIGMSLGILIWGTTNCLFGWASGRFGWFGLTPRPPKNDVLNYLGLVCVLIGGAMFSMIESRPNTQREASATNPSESAVEYERLTPDLSDEEDLETRARRTEPPAVAAAPITDKRRHLFGVIASLCAGFFYGVTFCPVIYIQDHSEEFGGASKQGLPYVFAHYSGIFLTATAFFLIYGGYKRNRPVINARTVIPAYITGTLWAVAQSAWFVANESLSQAVSFPIIAMMPGVIASLWGVLYFREIRGRRNLRILCAAIAVTLTGAVLVGLSKDISF